MVEEVRIVLPRSLKAKLEDIARKKGVTLQDLLVMALTKLLEEEK